ncbi:MAG: efflux RND transporter periplasmic adaptor subunit, partial [Candidatus Omnitrophica bacterium]|nr:efflux RND transporter periplasmic adaptor subunit [Candidatus Omnitrophota bacterium]
YAPVLLTPQKQQLIGVTTAAVERRALTKTIRAVGRVAHDPELYQAQQEFIQAVGGLQRAQAGALPEAAEQARQLVEAGRLRLRHMGLSEEMIDAIAGQPEPDHRLLLGGAGQFWVYAAIYEYELPLVRLGQQAAIEVEAFPGLRFAGTVQAIDPMLDAATRTTRARILIEDPEGLLKPEMYVTASIAVDLGQVLAVPAEAVFDTGTQRIVFVDQGQGLFEPRAVVLGAKADAAYEVKQGVAEGERVVTSGNFLIDSESRLKAALQGATGGAHQHGNE